MTEYNFSNDIIRWQISKSTKVSQTFFALAHRFRDINFFNFWPSESRSMARSTIFAIIPFNGKCQNVHMSPTHFCTSSYRFRDVTILNFLPSKSSSRLRSTIFAIIPFDDKTFKCLTHIFVLAFTVSEI